MMLRVFTILRIKQNKVDRVLPSTVPELSEKQVFSALKNGFSGRNIKWSWQESEVGKVTGSV